MDHQLPSAQEGELAEDAEQRRRRVSCSRAKHRAINKLQTRRVADAEPDDTRQKFAWGVSPPSPSAPLVRKRSSTDESRRSLSQDFPDNFPSASRAPHTEFTCKRAKLPHPEGGEGGILRLILMFP